MTSERRIDDRPSLDLDDLEAVDGGREVGTYSSLNRSFGLFSYSTTTYRDNATGEQFQTTTWGIGPSVPGWGASVGTVHANDANPTATTRDVATGWSASASLFDGNTTVNGTGYQLETAGPPNAHWEPWTWTSEVSAPRGNVQTGPQNSGAPIDMQTVQPDPPEAPPSPPADPPAPPAEDPPAD